MRKVLMCGLLGIGLPFEASAYKLTARTDAAQIAFGQDVQLVISADEQVSEQPDFSVLEPTFRVLSTGVSHGMNIINGQRSSSTEWTVRLLPLKEGDLTIPSVRVGSEQTTPLTLSVRAADDDTATQSARTPDQKPYRMKTVIGAADSDVYVQQQIRFDVVVTDNGSLQSGEPTLEFENPNDWLSADLGKPILKTRNVNGRLERTITYPFALYAQKSGRLRLPTVMFNGEALDDEPRAAFDPFGNRAFQFGGLFSFFQQTVPVRLAVPARELTVLPAPSDFSGHWWLPAEDVTLRAEWIDPKPVFRVGEAVTREMTLRAVGVLETQLPDLKNLQSVPDVKQYPQKDSGEERLENGQIVAERKMKVVYVPQTSGTITLPAVRVDWYNTKTGQFETAQIPEERLEIAPSATAPEVLKPVKTTQVAKADDSLDTDKPETAAENKTTDEAGRARTGKAILIVMVALLVGGLLRKVVKRAPKKTEIRQGQKRLAEKASAVIRAARRKDCKSVRNALIAWAETAFQTRSFNNLKDVAEAVGNSDLSAQIEMLQACLYRTETTADFDGHAFEKVFRKVLKTQHAQDGDDALLPPLYE